MTRVALYARYSSDQQSSAPTEDQFRVCRERAGPEGWHVAGSYEDAATLGASVIQRPGIQTLVQDAQAGRFDVVLAEALVRGVREAREKRLTGCDLPLAVTGDADG